MLQIVPIIIFYENVKFFFFYMTEKKTGNWSKHSAKELKKKMK